jgi:hypothetical protein
VVGGVSGSSSFSSCESLREWTFEYEWEEARGGAMASACSWDRAERRMCWRKLKVE